MKTKKLKIFSVVVSLLLLITAFGALTFTKQNNTVYATEVVIDNWEQQEGALLGDILEVPESVKLKIDENTTVDADSGIIYYPDGSAKTLGPKLLDVVGKYTLQYQSVVNGKTYIGEKSFFVKESNYYVSNNIFSSAEYVEADNLKYGKQLAENKADGIEVTLSKGDYFRFNQPINIFDIAKENGGMVDVSLAYPVMDTSLVSGDATAYKKDKDGNYVLDEDGNKIPSSVWGTRLGSYFTIKLIDCYDETNFIEFYFWSNQDKRNNIKHTSCGAGISGQKFSSLSKSTEPSATVTIDGATYTPSYSDRWTEGQWIGHWAYGNTYSIYYNGVSSFRLNVNTNEVYYGNTFITDVDHPQVYPDGQFKGFTTGEVYVQYSFENSWTSDPMELYIQSILGLSGEQLKKTAVSDEKQPDVNIDVEYTDVAEKSINIMHGEEFSLPTADVYDVNGKNEYKLAVYYDYYTDNPKSVCVKDGKFVPDKLGVVYTAVYLASDSFGNTNVGEDGRCVDVINMIPVKGEGLSYEESTVSSLESGVTNYLPAIDVVSKNKDVLTIVTIVTPQGERIDITETLDEEYYSFIPEYTGEYIVEYEFKDNVYSEVFDYKVSSIDNGGVLFVEKIALPSVFIKEAIYDLDEYYAYVASENGLSKRVAKLLVSVDGAEFEEITNQRQFKVEGNETLSFKAEYAGKQSQVQTCKITDVNFEGDASVNDGLKIYENYFVGFDGVNSTESYVEYEFDGGTTELLEYATPLVFDAFRLEFEIPEESAEKLNSVSVVLKEICGEERGYVITYAKTSSSSSFYYTITDLAGNSYYAMSVSGTFSGSHVITIANSTITTSEGRVVSVPGVTARNIEMSVLMPNTVGNYCLRIGNICGTAFNAYVYEKASELIYKRPDGYPEVGVKYTLPTFNISSVFYPISLANLSYSFKDAMGNVLVDVDGNAVEGISGDAPAVTIMPETVKLYFLEFSYDNFGSKLNVKDTGDFIVAVMDMTAPTTTFTDGANEETVVNVGIGKNHKIKKYTVIDDVTTSENLIVKVVVVDESSAVVGWDVENSFTFTKAGSYKVVIFAQDESGNTSKTYYKVLVK